MFAYVFFVEEEYRIDMMSAIAPTYVIAVIAAIVECFDKLVMEKKMEEHWLAKVKTEKKSIWLS